MWKTNRFVIAWIMSALVLTSCTKTQSKCPIESLIIDEHLFPEGTYAESLISPISGKPKESVARSFYYAPYDIFHAVINWHSSRSAKGEFNNDIETGFDTDQYMGPWETPSKVYSSAVADNYYVACGIVHGDYQCRLAATYGNYSVYFRADVGEEGITLQKVNEILQAIDETMAKCVN
jgi:hypothetical protein